MVMTVEQESVCHGPLLMKQPHVPAMRRACPFWEFAFSFQSRLPPIVIPGAPPVAVVPEEAWGLTVLAQSPPPGPRMATGLRARASVIMGRLGSH